MPTFSSGQPAVRTAGYGEVALNHDYFHIGSQSLQNMAAIVAGHPGDIVSTA